MFLERNGKLSNKLLAVFLSANLFGFIGCSSGVKDRTVSSLGGNLSSSQLDLAVEEELQSELELLDIDMHYQAAKALFSTMSFTKVDHFLSVKCSDSTLQANVNRYHNYAKILHSASAQDHVAQVLEDILERMQNDLRKDPSANRIKVILKIIDRVEDLKSKILDKAKICAAVKLKESEEAEEGPIEDVGDDKN